MVQEIINSLPWKISGFEPITAGFSSDKKFKLASGTGPLLLRVSDIAKSANREKEFTIIRQAFALGVKCNEPLKFGRLEGKGICYGCYRFIEGLDGDTVLAKLPEKDAFAAGVEAGRDLKKLHSILPPGPVSPWAERKRKKHEWYAAEYAKSGLAFPEDSSVLDFINREIHGMDACEDIFQHDDFHAGNIIILGNRYNGVIDFNRMDWGDYVQDFVKMGWYSRKVSVPFCNGQIRGYFGEAVPGDFWQRYALYMAMSLPASLVWHQQNFPHLMETAMKDVGMILADHDYFRQCRPGWVHS